MDLAGLIKRIVLFNNFIRGRIAMARPVLIVTIGMFFIFSCRNREHEKYTRIWIQNKAGVTDTLCDTTSDNFYDFTTQKTFFSESVFDTLWNSREYSFVHYKGIGYYVYKRDDFFVNATYKSLKVAIMPDTHDTNIDNAIKVYYIMERYGIIAVFEKRKTLDLLRVVYKGDTMSIQNFYPASARRDE